MGIEELSPVLWGKINPWGGIIGIYKGVLRKNGEEREMYFIVRAYGKAEGSLVFILYGYYENLTRARQEFYKLKEQIENSIIKIFVIPLSKGNI